MKTFDDVMQDMADWAENNIVGRFTVYHPPGKRQYGCYLEQTIKAREMEPEVKAAFEFLMDALGAEKGEFFRDKEGRPDRVTIIRQY
jgi:hypothetical protein